MIVTKCQLGSRALPLYLGLAIVLWNTGTARTGSIDYMRIDYSAPSPAPPGLDTIQYVPPPGVLDRSFDVATIGSGETIVDSARGQIKTIFVTAPTRDSLGNVFATADYSVSAILQDTMHFQGSGLVTIRFDTVGTGFLPQTDIFGDLGELVRVGTNVDAGFGTGNGHALDIFVNDPAFQGLPNYSLPLLGVPFTIHQIVDTTFDVKDGDARTFLFELQASGAGGSTMNLSDTTQLSFILPPGVSVRTDGGFVQAAVPEPSSLVLIVTGAAAALLGCLARSEFCGLGTRFPLKTRKDSWCQFIDTKSFTDFDVVSTFHST
jgi:hypothetical protein